MTTTTPRPDVSAPAPDMDPYALHPEAIETPPASLGRALRQVGPGLILAGTIVGTGELIATTHLGAKVGFAFLWLVIVSCFIKVFVQAELGRYAISSGHTTLATFASLPRPAFLVGWWWLAMMLLSQLQVAAMIGGVGYVIHMLVPVVSPLAGAVITAGATSALLAVGGYALVEKGSLALVVIFTIVTVLCVALLPWAGHPIVWSEVAVGLQFTIPKIDGALVAALAMFGITGVGATELIFYPYWCIEKGYARKTGPNDGSDEWLARARGWVRVMKLDVWLSLVVYTVATLAFYFLGAAVLHGPEAAGLPSKVEGMLSRLAQMYVPVLGEGPATAFIMLGGFAVLYSTLYGATAANARTLADFLHTNCTVRFSQPGSRRRWVTAFCIAIPLADLLLFWAVQSPVKMVIAAGFMQGLTLPLVAAAAIYLRYRRIDQRLISGWLWDVLLWLSFLGLLLTAMYVIVEQVNKIRVIMHPA